LESLEHPLKRETPYARAFLFRHPLAAPLMFSSHRVTSVGDAHLAKGDRDLAGSRARVSYHLFKKSEKLLVAFLIVQTARQARATGIVIYYSINV